MCKAPEPCRGRETPKAGRGGVCKNPVFSMKPISTSTYTFADLVGNGFVYVDKTAHIHRIASTGKGQYFIARPRRFGKSLLVSTLKALFEARRELFRGLAIDSLPWDWTPIPVLHLDMGSSQADTGEALLRRIDGQLANIQHDLGLEPEAWDSVPARFRNLCRAAAAKSPTGKIAILVDEYDKPILGLLGRPEVAGVRDVLKAFYSVVKTTEPLQRFVLVTGVSKFSKVSIFSDLNNLDDITLDAAVATLFGYTHEEVLKYFPENLAALGEKLGKTADGAFGEIVKWYDGYKFHQDGEPVINPVSLGLCFKRMELSNWWSLTAMPTFLLEFFKVRPLDVSELSVTDADMAAYEPESIKPATLLFQTGYLTIKGFEQDGADRTYTLGFPNLEVENSFLRSLSTVYIGREEAETVNISRLAREALRRRDPEGFVEAFRQFFATIPYDLTDRQNEQSWQAIMYVVLRIIGINANGEVRTHKGRIDLTVETAQDAYIIEVKRDSTAKKAIEQIQTKEYTDRFRLTGKPITLIGMAFSTKKRAVSSVKIVRDA